MRELLKKEQQITIVPQDFKNTNKGIVTEVNVDGFRMRLKYKPKGIINNHICDFYSLTDNGYLYFESYVQSVENNVISVASPIKHRFLQRRRFTRIKYVEDLGFVNDGSSYKVRSLDLSAGGMKVTTTENLDMEKEYNVDVKLAEEKVVRCKYQLIRSEKGENGMYTISGKFVGLSNIDKMTLIQYCMKKNMENSNK